MRTWLIPPTVLLVIVTVLGLVACGGKY